MKELSSAWHFKLLNTAGAQQVDDASLFSSNVWRTSANLHYFTWHQTPQKTTKYMVECEKMKCRWKAYAHQ